MTLDSETIHSISQQLMAVGFTAAALANVWRRNWGYVVALVLAIVETYRRHRFEFHNWARDQMIGVAPPAGAKEVLQSQLLYVGGMLAVALLVLLLPYLIRANGGRRLMVLGSLMAAGVLSLELISPHHIDAIIYQRIGIFALAAIVYFISGILMACGALLDRDRNRRPSIASPQT